MSTLYLKDQQIEDSTIYLELLLTARVIRWNKLPRCWQLKDKKNFPLTIDDYSLKHNSLIRTYNIQYIYIYIYMERETRREKSSLLLCMRGNELRYLAGAVFSILFNFGEWGFCWRGFSSRRDFFSNILSLVWTSDVFSHLTLKHLFLYWISLRTSNPDWLTNHRSFCKLLLLLDWSSNQMCWSMSVGKVYLPFIRFWLVI